MATVQPILDKGSLSIWHIDSAYHQMLSDVAYTW
jgi:hypothetical protein